MGLAKIKNNIDNLAKSYNVANQTLWDMFFFENFLNRLSKSKYKTNFVFKGGFLLGSIVGIEQRTTLDIDLKYVGTNLDDVVLLNVFREICEVDLDDEIKYEVLDITEITKEKKYAGKSVRILSKYFNIQKIFNIDIAKGDIVTPNPVLYNYKSNITKTNFDILAYSKETILAEKIETLISKGEANSRSKDLFDIYLLSKEEYNIDIFNSAIINTFYVRNTELTGDICVEAESILSFFRIKELFESYVKKNKFTNGLEYEECKDAILDVIKNIEFSNKIDLSEIHIDLLRHGEDEQDKLGGWSDNHLTTTGIMQITDVSDYLDKDYDLIISSDLVRTRETADIVAAKLSKSIIFDEKFREINNGKLKNLTKEEFNLTYPGLYYNTLSMDQAYPNGESPTDFYIRIKDAFIELLYKYKGKKILIITHGGVITVLQCLINGWKYSNLLKITVPHAALVKLNKQ